VIHWNQDLFSTVLTMVHWNQGWFSTVLTGWFIETRIYLVQY